MSMNQTAYFEIPQRDPCPFCENIAGRHPCAIVEETDTTFAFVNPRQYGKGALLVTPRHHAPTVLELGEDEAAAIMRHVVRLAHAITAAYGVDGLNIFQNNGSLAGQTVAHYHVHIVPRYRDAPTAQFFSSENFPRTPFEERVLIAEHIKRHLGSRAGATLTSQ